MPNVSNAVGRLSAPPTGVSIPPRPQWLPDARTPVPPRPQWLPERSRPPAVRRLDNPETPSVSDVLSKRPVRNWGQDRTAFLVSLSLHLMLLLLLWQMFRFVTRPEPSGYVISCEIDTVDDGAESPVLAMVDSPLPKVQPAAIAHATAIELTRVSVGSGRPGGERPMGGGGGGVGFFGARASANSVVFVVDKSGSMSDQMRIETAKEELANALQLLQPDQWFYVIFYDDQIHRMLAPAAPQQLVPATRDHINAALDWVESDVTANGGTHPQDSLLVALEMRPEVIFFLTDGDVEPETAAIVHLNNTHHTIIHTLCLSNDFGEQVMRRIAHENQGRYRFVETGSPSVEKPTRPSQAVKVADAKLRNASRHLRQGRTTTGKRLLQKLITDHPGTPQARQAQSILDSFPVSP